MRSLLMTTIGICLLNSSIAYSQEYRFVGSQFPHILEKDEQGQIKGIAAELIRKVMTNLGHDAAINVYPWKRAQAMVTEGQAEVLIGPYKTEQRLNLFTFSQYHFYQDNMVLYQARDAHFNWRGDLSQLKGQKIGVMAGWAYGDNFDQYRSQLSLVTVYSLNSCFSMLTAKRLQLCALNQRNAEAYLEQHKNKYDFLQVTTPIDSIKGYFGFSKRVDTKQLQLAFDQELKKLIDNQYVAELNAKAGLFYQAP